MNGEVDLRIIDAISPKAAPNGCHTRSSLEPCEDGELVATRRTSVEDVDPGTLVPMDAETIRASVRKTGRVVVGWPVV